MIATRRILGNSLSRQLIRAGCSLGAFILLSVALHAQWGIPARVVLDGAEDSDRQILGLGTPDRSDALMSADSERRTTANRTTVQGTDILIGALVPALSAYTVGLIVTIVPEQANAAGARIDLNGLGARDMFKSGGVPLDSADLKPGLPVQLIHDGEHFQVLSSIALNCPPNYSSAVREYCIADSSVAAVSFFTASVACAARGARLCTSSEWAHACGQLPGFLATVSTAEWVDHAANNGATAKVVGAGNNGSIDLPGTGCNYGGWSLPMTPYRYRCCTNR